MNNINLLSRAANFPFRPERFIIKAVITQVTDYNRNIVNLVVDYVFRPNTISEPKPIKDLKCFVYSDELRKETQLEFFKTFELLMEFFVHQLGMAPNINPEITAQLQNQVNKLFKLPHGQAIMEETIYCVYMNAFTTLRDVTKSFLSEMIKAEHRKSGRNQKDLDVRLKALDVGFSQLSNKVYPLIIEAAEEASKEFYKSKQPEVQNKFNNTSIPLKDGILFSGWFAFVNNFGSPKVKEFWANLPEQIQMTNTGINGFIDQFEKAYDCRLEEGVDIVLRNLERLFSLVNRPEELLTQFGPMITQLCMLAVAGKETYERSLKDSNLSEQMHSFLAKQYELQRAAKDNEPSFALVDVGSADPAKSICESYMREILSPKPLSILINYISEPLQKAPTIDHVRTFMTHDPLMKRMLDERYQVKLRNAVQHHLSENIDYQEFSGISYQTQKLLESCSILENFQKEISGKDKTKVKEILGVKKWGPCLLNAYEGNIEVLMKGFLSLQSYDDFRKLVQSNVLLKEGLAYDYNGKAAMYDVHKAWFSELNIDQLRPYIESNFLLRHIFKDFKWDVAVEVPSTVIEIGKRKWGVKVPSEYSIQFMGPPGQEVNLLQIPVNDPRIQAAIATLNNTFILPSVADIQKLAETQLDKLANDAIRKIEEQALRQNLKDIQECIGYGNYLKDEDTKKIEKMLKDNSIKEILPYLQARFGESLNSLTEADIERIMKVNGQNARREIQTEVLPIVDMITPFREALLTTLLFGVKEFVPGTLFKSESHFYKPFKKVFLTGAINAASDIAKAIIGNRRKPNLINLGFMISSIIVDSSKKMAKQFSTVK